MNYCNILSALGAAAFGLIIAYINMRITKAHINADTVLGVMGVNTLRMILNVAALSITYFVSKAFSLPMTAMLVAVALGLSLGGIAFLKLMINKTQPQTSETADGGEKK